MIFILESHTEDDDDDAVEEEDVIEDVVELQNLLLFFIMTLFVVSILVENWDNDCESLDVACEAHDDESKSFRYTECIEVGSWTECIIVGDVNDVKGSSDIESMARFF